MFKILLDTCMPVLHDVAMKLKRQLNHIKVASTCTQPKQKPSLMQLRQDSQLIKKKLATSKGATAAYSSVS